MAVFWCFGFLFLFFSLGCSFGSYCFNLLVMLVCFLTAVMFLSLLIKVSEVSVCLYGL